MPTKLPKTFTKAFTKTKLGFHIERELAKGEFLWQYDYKPKLEDNAWHPSGNCVPSVHELWTGAKHAKIVKDPRDLTMVEKSNPKFRQMEPSLVKIFQVGHFWHQYLQEVCLRAGFCEKENIERNGVRGWGDMATAAHYKPYHWATGSADICPCEVPGAGPYLIDFKTMGSFQFKGSPSEEVLTKWECQLNIYMDFFDMEKAMIVGINKDTPHDFREWEYHRNEPLVDAIYYKWKLVSECLDAGIEPPEDEVVDLPTMGAVNV